MRGALLLPVLAIAGAVALSSVYTVDEREQVLILQFGEVKKEVRTPGLGFKLPLVQEVVRYEDRILGLQTQPIEVTPADDRRLVVDAFSRWRIANLIAFREAVGSGGEDQARTRLERIVDSAIREVLGSVDSSAVVSAERGALMGKIRDMARTEAQALGVEIIDVRLTRTDLPRQNLEATYARMRAEREREATDEIARGREAAQRITAAADRSVVETTSQAKKESEVIRGEADAARNRIYAEAYGKDPEFFAFTRSLAAYESSLKGETTSVVLSPEATQFFDYFANPQGAAKSAE